MKTKTILSQLTIVRLTLFLVSFMLFAGSATAQTRQNFRLPDIPGYITLKGDFHMHTPFSDGTVWPTDRVKEAWRDGLDVIAITDHLEYNPNQKDVSNDANRPWEIARPVADEYGIILIKAAEITRRMPPGHFNAYFLNDCNLLRQDDIEEAFRAAARQGAFFVWNHPGWKAQQPDTTIWFPMHDQFLENGWLQGIEVFNEKEFYPIVHQWAVDKGLTIFANSDVHEPIDFLYQQQKNERRPMTLVFAKERSVDGVRDAFFNRRTAALFNDTLIGDEKHLKPLIGGSLSVQNPHVEINSRSEAFFVLKNDSDLTLILEGISNEEFSLPGSIHLKANSSERIPVKNIRNLQQGENELAVAFMVKNVLTAPGSPLKTEIQLTVFQWNIPRITHSAGNNWRIDLTDESGKLTYHYTTNGANPTLESPQMDVPFQARDSITLSIAAFSGQTRAGSLFEGTFTLHRALNQRVILENQPEPKYSANGAQSLTDGLRGSADYREGKWLGFKGSSMEAIIEFQSPTDITGVEARFLDDQKSWIFLPAQVLVLVSEDGSNYRELGKVTFASAKAEGSKGVVNATVKRKVGGVRRVKIIARNQGVCPEWHSGAGQPAWLFADEIIIR